MNSEKWYWMTNCIIHILMYRPSTLYLCLDFSVTRWQICVIVAKWHQYEGKQSVLRPNFILGSVLSRQKIEFRIFLWVNKNTPAKYFLINQLWHFRSVWNSFYSPQIPYVCKKQNIAVGKYSFPDCCHIYHVIFFFWYQKKNWNKPKVSQ